MSKPHEFGAVEIPEQFGPRELLIDEARVKAFAFAQDDYCSWHFAGSPFGAPVAHASILANELMQIYFERYRIDVHEDAGGAWLEEAHVEETLWFCDPIPVGERVTLEGRFVDKYVKGGRGAVVLEGEARGADGRLLMGHRAIEYFRMDGPVADTAPARPEAPMRRVQPRPDAELEPAACARAGLAPGTPIPALRKRITFPQQLVFSSLDHPEARRSVHTDHEIARRAGLPGPLVQGQQLACHVCEALALFFGAAWYTSGRVRIKFLGEVCAGETVTIGGVVTGEAPAAGRSVAGGGLTSAGALTREGREELELDVWIEDAAGSSVAVANASAEVPPKDAQRAPAEGVAYLPTGW